jgi:hypothetical protein
LIFAQLKAQNNALLFDGDNDYLSVSNLQLSGSTHTLEAWIYPESFSSDDFGISQIVYGGGENILLRIGDAGYDNNQVQFVVSVGGHQRLASTIRLTANNWYHVAGTYDGTTMKLYINGILDNELVLVEGGSIATTEDFLGIGGNADGAREFDGLIDEVRIWNDVRTASEIRANMLQELPNYARETNLVAYYMFNEPAGTTANDSKAGSYDATLANMTGEEWMTSSAMFGPKHCLDFDGSNDYAQTASLLNIGSEFTVEFWMNVDLLKDYGDPVSFGTDDHYLTFISSADGSLLFTTGNGSDWGNGVSLPAGSITQNKWHHVVGVSTGSLLKLYFDGELISESASNSNSINQKLNIGTRPAMEYYFDGQIDELRVWSDERTALEIRSNMNKSLVGNESGLMAYYGFDNTAGTSLQDLSSSTYDATLNNMDNTDWHASSAYNTWLNTSSNNWAYAANWSRASVPSSSDNVGVYNLTTSPNVSGTPSISSLYIGASTSVELLSNLTISGSLILDANLDMDGYEIYLGENGYLYEDLGYLTGASGKIEITKNFTTGIDSVNIGGLGAIIKTDDILGSTTITRMHDTISNSIERNFQIAPTNDEGLDAQLTLLYHEHELQEHHIETELALYFSVDDGLNWSETEGHVLSYDENHITISGLDHFSLWTISTSGSVLPVELSKFQAFPQDNSIELEWETLSEINSDRFILERSLDGSDFEIIYTTASGNSNQTKTYYYTDYQVNENQVYYFRLVEQDTDGRLKTLETISAKIERGHDNLFKVYPNPCRQVIYIETDKECNLKMLDIQRKLVNAIQLDKGLNRINMSSYHQGFYILEWESDGELHHQKILHQ